MTCPHCGAEVTPGHTFCPCCRERVLPPGTGLASTVPPSTGPAFGPGPPLARHGAVTVLAVLDVLVGLACLLGLAVGVFGAAQGSGEDRVTAIVLIPVYGILALVYFGAAIGMFQLRNWGRILQMTLAFIGLLSIPCGTILSILILIYLFKPGTKILFSGRTAESLTAEEMTEVEAARKAGYQLVVMGGLGMFVLIVVVTGIIAAIAIPSLLRARVSANEARAMGHLRAAMSAEQAYAGANAGFYDTLECVAAPTTCIPGISPTTTPFIDPAQVSNPVRAGYRYEFHPGPRPTPLDPLVSSPSSMASFAYTAVPVQPGKTGRRGFCGDSSGRLCFTMDGTAPAIQDGQCAVDCRIAY